MKKRLCSVVLALALCLALPCPALGVEEASWGSYEEAVAELRDGPHYNKSSERTYETDDCTIFIYDNGGVMRPPHNRIAIIYKAGSQPGEGAHIYSECPYALMLYRGPDRLALSEDKRTLTYAFVLENDVEAASLKAGIYTYTVDLPTGTTTSTYAPISCEGLADVLAQGADHTLEKRLDGPLGSAILRWSNCVSPDEQGNALRDYELYLVSKDGDPLSQRLILPSTVNTNTAYSPTHIPPDSMSFSEDGKTLTYVYTFDSALLRGDTLLHDAGTYTYRVDTATGELKVEFEKSVGAEGTTFVDVAPVDWFASYVNVCVEAGLMNGVGGGRFDPQGTVTLAQAATLAARIHHIKNGGDGVLPQAPEDYGTVTLEFENGLRLRFDSAECGTTISPMSRGHLWVGLSEEKTAAMGWLDMGQEAQAKVWVVLPEPAGPYSCEVHRQSGSSPDRDALVLYPSPDGTPEDREAVNDLVGDLFKAHRRPLPGDWYRDTVCYLEKEGLTSPLVLRTSEPDKTADRGDFVEALHATAADMLTPKLNDITDFPDAGAEYDVKELAEKVLDFYNAGVMTGKDGLGTFDKDSTLTRAEAAAICARILKRELRVKFQPQPVPEKYSYTLTYLMDDPMDGHTVTYPVMPIIGGANSGILTLDGDLLPWPREEGKPANMLAAGTGGGLYLSFWFTQPDGTKVEKGGLMDETGTFVVPLNDFCYRATSLNSGKYLSQTGLPENGVCTLWDEEGNATELGSMDWHEAIEANGGYRASAWAPDIARGRYCYVDELGHRVSENFDWMGALTDSGRGFVGKDGKLYRIQFQGV